MSLFLTLHRCASRNICQEQGHRLLAEPVVNQVYAMSAYGDLAASGQIRLLKLDDVQPDSDLNGTLRVVNLDNLPKYYAIPYTWGSAEDSKQIIVHGAAYTIRKNLWECLHALMNNFEHLRGSWLWADALCIRQDSVEEKNSQVAQIHHVFAGAEHVYAWLGSDPQVEQSLSCFRTSLDEFELQCMIYHHLLLRMNSNPTTPPEIDTEPLKAVAFCSYFTRTWTVQECALARSLTFVCGRATWYVKHRDRLPTAGMEWAIEHLLAARYNLHDNAWQGVERLLDVIWISRSTVCDEPRDTVFAVQSMADPLTRCVVDYAIAPCDLFWQVILADVGITQWGLAEREALHLQKALKASWDDITSSVRHMSDLRSQKPSIKVRCSSKRLHVARATCEVTAVDDKAKDMRLVVLQQDCYYEVYQELKAFHLLYGTKEDNDICLIFGYGCEVLIVIRASGEDSRCLNPCGIALQTDAEIAERALKVLDKLWESSIELSHETTTESLSNPLRVAVRVSPRFLDALHKIGRHTGALA